MKKLYLLIAISNVVLTAHAHNQPQSQEKNDTSSTQDEQHTSSGGVFGRYDKSEALAQDHYQTSTGSKTRLWLALKLMSHNSTYKVSQQGLDNALKVAAHNDDIKKVTLLINHGARPQEALEAAINGYATQTSQLLLDKGAQVKPEHLKALERCLRNCFQDNPQDIQKHLTSYSCGKNIAHQLERNLDDVNQKLILQENAAVGHKKKYEEKLKAALARLEVLQQQRTLNEHNLKNLRMVKNRLEGSLKTLFNTMDKVSHYEELECQRTEHHKTLQENNEQQQDQEQLSWWEKLFPPSKR